VIFELKPTPICEVVLYRTEVLTRQDKIWREMKQTGKYQGDYLVQKILSRYIDRQKCCHVYMYYECLATHVKWRIFRLVACGVVTRRRPRVNVFSLLWDMCSMSLNWFIDRMLI